MDLWIFITYLIVFFIGLILGNLGTREERRVAKARKNAKIINSQETTIERLKQLTEILDNNNIHFWLTGGALLSFMQVGKLLHYGFDVDLVIWEETFERLLKIVPLLKKKFIVDVSDNKIVVKTEGRKFDVSLGVYKLERDLAIRRYLSIKNKFGALLYYRIMKKTKHKTIKKLALYIGCITKSTIPVEKRVAARYFKNLKYVNFFGIRIRIPEDAEGYCEYTYGKTWRIPGIKWTSGKNPTYFIRKKFRDYKKWEML